MSVNIRTALNLSVILTLGFLGLVESVRGQSTIVYVQPSQPINYGTYPLSYNLDLNNDGITDFVMSCDIGGVNLTPQDNNRVVVDGSFLVAALNQGEQISPSLNPVYQWTGSSVTLGAQAVFDGQYFYAGNFSSKDAFIGLEFQAGGNNYFGWMEVTNFFNIAAGQVLGWAYETVPNTPILAGQVPEASSVALFILGGAVVWFRCNWERNRPARARK
jgi:hypothetical protein